MSARQRRAIHNRIAALRADRRMSRADLAQRIDVNVQSLGSIERGDYYPSLDLAMRICEVFEMPVEAVFSRTEFPPIPEPARVRRLPHADLNEGNP